MSKEEKARQKIQSREKLKRGKMSLELLARIQTLEETVIDMNDNKYAKVLDVFPNL